MEEGEEALRNYCRRMILRVRSKQPRRRSSEEEPRRHRHSQGARGRERTEPEGPAVTGDDFRGHTECNLPLPDCTNPEREQTSHNLMCQGPEVQPVPPQLISMLRLKTLQEAMRRAADAELHDPAACSVCVQEQASLALKSFIRRKKTQLQFQTLKGRLNNTHLSCGECARWGSLCKIFQRPLMPLTGFGRNYLVDICGSQQPGIAIATSKERGVALATDEMRGYPDKNATGTNLASPGCPFSDR